MPFEIFRTPHYGVFHCALLDFDGTISLIREGWQEIMIAYFSETLQSTPQGKNEDYANLEHDVREFVALLTGKQTIYQCIQLAEEVKLKGGSPQDPLEYKQEYHHRLEKRIANRITELENKTCDPREHLVPGAYELLELLRRRGLRLYLASGTDEVYVKREAELLDVAKYFDGGIFGAHDDYKRFSKAKVIQDIIREQNVKGEELLGFGDGYVEIENVKHIGGYAVGVASNESERIGIDGWKQQRLVRAGADVIIPDYRELEALEAFLFGR